MTLSYSSIQCLRGDPKRTARTALWRFTQQHVAVTEGLDIFVLEHVVGGDLERAPHLDGIVR